MANPLRLRKLGWEEKNRVALEQAAKEPVIDHAVRVSVAASDPHNRFIWIV
jgi:hypothetical protein